MSCLNQVVSNDQFRRFRWKHHYYSQLRYWSDYQHAFTYLDAKAEGLLAISGLKAVVYALVLSSDVDALWLTNWAFYAAVSGFFVVIGAIVLLLQCFRVTANQRNDARDQSMRAFEGFFPGDGYRKEANCEAFIAAYSELVKAHGNEIDAKRKSLETVWSQIFKVDGLDKNCRERFHSALEALESLFLTLRTQVEKEVEHRRRCYKVAHFLVYFGLVPMTIILVAIISVRVN